MKTNLFTIMLIMSFASIISSCSLSDGSHGKGNIFESEWGLVSVKTNSADSLLVARHGNTVTLNVLSDGTIKGVTGCNSFEGQVAIDDYSLKFGNLICTQRICVDSILTKAFYATLDSTDNYTVDHGHLLLKKGDKVLATFMSMDVR